MEELNSFVFGRGPDEPLLSALFSLFEEIASKIQKSDEAAALSKEYNSEFLSIIRSYTRRIHVAFMSMSFEQACGLATEFEMYANGGLPVVHDPLTIEENIEKTMMELQTGIRDKDRLLDELETQCDQLRQLSLNPTSRSLLQAEALVAEERCDEMKAVEKTYEFSDVPESRLNLRVGVERDCAPGTDTSMETITEAALNVALCRIRIGHLRDAMQLVNEHMRVSQQTSNSRALVFSLGALCQILARAVPGALELQSTGKHGKSRGDQHYVELAELLRRLEDQSQDESIPEMTLFARLLATELDLLVDNGLDDIDRGYYKNNGDHDGSNAEEVAERERTPCQAASATLDTCLYTKQLACELSTLAAGGPSKLPSSLFAPPKPAGDQSFNQSDSRTALFAQQCTQTANQIRAAGWQVWGSSRLSLEMALGVLHSANKNQEAELSSLSLLLANLYDQFGCAPIDHLGTNSKLMSLIKTNIELQRTWDMIHQKTAVHAGNWRDALDMASRIHVHPKTDDVTHLRHTIESYELAATAYLAGSKYNDADQLAKQGYILARKACITTYSLQLLLLRGRIHLEAGSWETACPFFRAVLSKFKDHHADMIGAEACMYMSQVKMHEGDLQTAMQELSSCLPTLLAHGALETKSAARIAMAKLLIKQAAETPKPESRMDINADGKDHTDGNSSLHDRMTTSTDIDPPALDPATARQILPLLRDAERDITKLRAKKLKSEALYLASIAYDKLGDRPRRDACATAWTRLRHPNDDDKTILDQRFITT